MNDIAPPGIRFRTEAEEKARHEGNKLTKRLARETCLLYTSDAADE